MAAKKSRREWDETEKELAGAVDKPEKATDYWDDVADDAATGYRTPEDKDELLNVDQLPDDPQRGDAESQ